MLALGSTQAKCYPGRLPGGPLPLLWGIYGGRSSRLAANTAPLRATRGSHAASATKGWWGPLASLQHRGFTDPAAPGAKALATFSSARALADIRSTTALVYGNTAKAPVASGAIHPAVCSSTKALGTATSAKGLGASSRLEDLAAGTNSRASSKAQMAGAQALAAGTCAKALAACGSVQAMAGFCVRGSKRAAGPRPLGCTCRLPKAAHDAGPLWLPPAGRLSMPCCCLIAQLLAIDQLLQVLQPPSPPQLTPVQA